MRIRLHLARSCDRRPGDRPATGTTEEPADIRTAADAMQKQDKTCTATLSVVDKKDKHPIEGALVQAAGPPKGTVTGKDGPGRDNGPRRQ